MMAEDKQLTVAEILARARQDNPDAAAPTKRRRRRSVEEGGITVAELTGSFKAVDAAPAQPRHSSVPLEDPNDPKLAAMQEKAEKAGDTSVAEATEAAEAEEAAEAAQTADVAEAAQVQQAPEDTEAVALDAEPEEASQEVSEVAEAQEAEEQAQDSVSTDSLPSEQDTGVINKVSDDVQPAEADDAPGATGVMPVVQEDAWQENAVQDPAVDTADPQYADGSTAVFDLEQNGQPVNELAVRQPAEAELQQQALEDEEGTSIWALIGLVVLGVVAGILIFLGFQFLWARLSAWMVAIAAIVVTVIMVLGVKSLRTASDGLSMTLAGIVGLVVTFGPAALYYL